MPPIRLLGRRALRSAGGEPLRPAESVRPCTPAVHLPVRPWLPRSQGFPREADAARAVCMACRTGFVAAFSCKGRGVCPSCNGRHMAQTAAHLADHVILPVPVRQWVISVPKRLRDMLADQPRAVAARSAGSGLRACSTLRPPPTCWPGRTADFQETRVSGSRSIDRDVPSYFQSLEHLLRYCARPPFALERLESKAPLARHVANRLGETPGPGG